MLLKKVNDEQAKRIHKILCDLEKTDEVIFISILAIFMSKLEINGIEKMEKIEKTKYSKIDMIGGFIDIKETSSISIDELVKTHKDNNFKIYTMDVLIFLEKFRTHELFEYEIKNNIIELTMFNDLFVHMISISETCIELFAKILMEYVHKINSSNINQSKYQTYIDMMFEKQETKKLELLQYIYYSQHNRYKQTIDVFLTHYNSTFKYFGNKINYTKDEVINIIKELEVFGMITVHGDINDKFIIEIYDEIKDAYLKRFILNSDKDKMCMIAIHNYLFVLQIMKAEENKKAKLVVPTLKNIQENVKYFFDLSYIEILKVLNNLIEKEKITIEGDLPSETEFDKEIKYISTSPY